MTSGFIVRNSKRYVSISPGAVYEQSVQNLVFQNFEGLLPGFDGRRLEPFFETPAGNVKPDLVAIRRDYSGWALVEVEIQGHSWSNHILPQMSKLALTGIFDTDIEKIIEVFSPNHERENIKKALMHDPEIFLIIHGTAKDAAEKLARLKVKVIELDIHHCPPNDYLIDAVETVSHLVNLESKAHRSDRALTHRLWTLKCQPYPQYFKGEKLLVNFDGFVSFWDYSRQEDQYILSPPSDFELDGKLVIADANFDVVSGALFLSKMKGSK